MLLDTRRNGADRDLFELAIEVSASVLDASSRRRDLIRLVTTARGDSGFATGGTHLESIMQYLASADQTPTGTLLAARDSILTQGGGGALVACLVDPPSSEIDEMLRMRRTFDHITVVICRSGGQPSGSVRAAGSGAMVIETADATSFVNAWTTAHGRPVAATSSLGAR